MRRLLALLLASFLPSVGLAYDVEAPIEPVNSACRAQREPWPCCTAPKAGHCTDSIVYSGDHLTWDSLLDAWAASWDAYMTNQDFDPHIKWIGDTHHLGCLNIEEDCKAYPENAPPQHQHRVCVIVGPSSGLDRGGRPVLKAGVIGSGGRGHFTSDVTGCYSEAGLTMPWVMWRNGTGDIIGWKWSNATCTAKGAPHPCCTGPSAGTCHSDTVMDSEMNTHMVFDGVFSFLAHGPHKTDADWMSNPTRIPIWPIARSNPDMGEFTGYGLVNIDTHWDLGQWDFEFKCGGDMDNVGYYEFRGFNSRTPDLVGFGCGVGAQIQGGGGNRTLSARYLAANGNGLVLGGGHRGNLFSVSPGCAKGAIHPSYCAPLAGGHWSMQSGGGGANVIMSEGSLGIEGNINDLVVQNANSVELFVHFETTHDSASDPSLIFGAGFCSPNAPQPRKPCALDSECAPGTCEAPDDTQPELGDEWVCGLTVKGASWNRIGFGPGFDDGGDDTVCLRLEGLHLKSDNTIAHESLLANANRKCTAAAKPWPCCTGAGTGDCGQAALVDVTRTFSRYGRVQMPKNWPPLRWITDPRGSVGGAR